MNFSMNELIIIAAVAAIAFTSPILFSNCLDRDQSVFNEKIFNVILIKKSK